MLIQNCCILTHREQVHICLWKIFSGMLKTTCHFPKIYALLVAEIQAEEEHSLGSMQMGHLTLVLDNFNSV